ARRADEQGLGSQTRVAIAHGPHTPNMPRTQVTICGAPNAIAIPKIAPIHQPQDMRFAIAMAPRAITRMTAIGVSQARMLLWSAVAPVKNGDAWAEASAGRAIVTTPAPALNNPAAYLGDMGDLRAVRCVGDYLPAPARREQLGQPGARPLSPLFSLEFLALDLARCAEAKAIDDEGMVVLPLALLVGPVVGADPCLDDQLIALASTVGDRLAECAEGDEPQAGHDLARAAVFLLAGIIIADQAEARIGTIPLGIEFRVLGEITHGGDFEAVHLVLLLSAGWRCAIRGAESRKPAGDCLPRNRMCSCRLARAGAVAIQIRCTSVDSSRVRSALGPTYSCTSPGS